MVWVRRERDSQDSDYEHVRAHEEGAQHQRAAATDALNEEQQEEETGYNLADAEEAGKKQLVLAGADEREDLRCVWTS